MPSPPYPRRDQLIRIIREAAGTVEDAARPSGNPRAHAEALAAACRKEGLEPEVFDAALAEDPELQRLSAAAFAQGVAGLPDPGPNASISRESPSGQPGDLEKSRSRPEPPAH